MSNDLLTSALDAETQIEENSRDGLLNAAITGTGIGSSAYLLKKYGGEDSTLSNFYQKLLGTEFLQRQLNTAPTWVNSGASTFTNQSVMKSLLSQLMAIEEASPLHVFRTLQLSNFLQPFVDITQSNQEILFSERKIRNQKHYYQTLIEFANKVTLSPVLFTTCEMLLGSGLTIMSIPVVSKLPATFICPAFTIVGLS